MSQRFNAPPGWQVPEGFVPPTGWQPDPSWPPAPAGWNFWVDDAAPGNGPPAAPAAGYGPAAPSGYGDGASHAPGSANSALAVTRVKNARKSVLIGIGVFVVGLIINVVSLANPGNDGRSTLWWGILLIGIVIAIRGIVDYSKAKKALGEIATSGMANAYGNSPAGAPMPQAGHDPQQQMPTPGQPQQSGQRDDDGQRPMGDVYR
ncbi:MAG TPA: hypothetical protein H9815_17565 [Candidatus Ruania gallistercoris]|uniref:Uncharacterized protein n=1 Tax=Candidatus Ruania gallistercoris TaxID=2838746 RepID=A0A9D2EH07_9MICO|nr:hypothetical protein [Candidatus Ruania gallistercoris]